MRWMEKRIRGLVVGGVVALAVAGSTLLAQGTTATILGVIHDQSEAVLPGVTVTAMNIATGISRNTVSGTRGEFRIPALPPGSYEVQAAMAGFQTGIRNALTLSVGQEATLNYTLAVGNVTESVTIPQCILYAARTHLRRSSGRKDSGGGVAVELESTGGLQMEL